MPGSILRKKGGGVKATWGGRVVAKHTTIEKAEAQQRLLRGVEHGWQPTGKSKRRLIRKHD